MSDQESPQGQLSFQRAGAKIQRAGFFKAGESPQGQLSFQHAGNFALTFLTISSNGFGSGYFQFLGNSILMPKKIDMQWNRSVKGDRFNADLM